MACLWSFFVRAHQGFPERDFTYPPGAAVRSPWQDQHSIFCWDFLLTPSKHTTLFMARGVFQSDSVSASKSSSSSSRFWPSPRHIKACLWYGGGQGNSGNQSSLEQFPKVDPLQLIPMVTIETMMEIHQRTQVKARISLFNSSGVRARGTWEGSMGGAFFTSSSPSPPPPSDTAALPWNYRHNTCYISGKGWSYRGMEQV